MPEKPKIVVGSISNRRKVRLPNKKVLLVLALIIALSLGGFLIWNNRSQQDNNEDIDFDYETVVIDGEEYKLLSHIKESNNLNDVAPDNRTNQEIIEDLEVNLLNDGVSEDGMGVSNYLYLAQLYHSEGNLQKSIENYEKEIERLKLSDAEDKDEVIKYYQEYIDSMRQELGG